MHEATAKYHSYLLRLWQEGERRLWHVSIHCVQSGEIVHFADLEAFVAFLRAQTAPPRPQETPVRPERKK
ncbi:MAG: hypothetical protein WAU00_09075 [Caldilinea sp.]